MSTSRLIRTAYQLTEGIESNDPKRYAEEAKKLLAFNREHNGDNLLIPLNFYLSLLNKTDPVLIYYMSEQQKKEALRQIQVTYVLLLAEDKYERDHQKEDRAVYYKAQLKKCQALIDAIEYHFICEQQQIKPAPEHGHISDEKPTSYLSLFAGYFFAHNMFKISSSGTIQSIEEQLGSTNQTRLYWVRTSGFLKTMIMRLPEEFFFADQAMQMIEYPDFLSGTLSWGLYYFRFALNLGLLMKHTIKGPWMSEEEKNESDEYFQTQLQQRKFDLLNDFFWGTANLLCFFLLYGNGAAGSAGNILTLGLLIMDISLATWDLEEQRIQYNQQIFDYEIAIEYIQKQTADLIKEHKGKEDHIQKKIMKLHVLLELTKKTHEKQHIDDYEETIKRIKRQETDLHQEQKTQEEQTQRELIELSMQLTALEQAKAQCAREWNYKKIILITNITYASGLMIAFALLTAPFFPLPAATISAMTVSGAVLCFAFSVIADTVKGCVEIHKTQTSAKELKLEYQQKIAAFKGLVHIGADDQAKKLMFLEIKKLTLNTEYEEKMLAYQTLKLLHTVLIECMVPPLIFISLVLLPLGPGILILSAAIALAIGTRVLLDALLKPKQEDLQPFNEAEYNSFCSNPEQWNKKETKALSFFKSTEHSKEQKEEQPESNLPLLGNDSIGG
jgi:hypothetical protein